MTKEVALDRLVTRVFAFIEDGLTKEERDALYDGKDGKGTTIAFKLDHALEVTPIKNADC